MKSYTAIIAILTLAALIVFAIAINAYDSTWIENEAEMCPEPN